MSDWSNEYRAATAFRRPLREPIEAFDVPHPAVPPALDGLTVLHLSDFHIRHFTPLRPKFERLWRALDNADVDLVVITGDIMDEPGQEQAAIDTLRWLMPAMHARHGILGVFGNHDSPDFRRRARAELPEILWLETQAAEVSIHGVLLRIIGLSWPEDPLTALLEHPLQEGGGRGLGAPQLPFPEGRGRGLGAGSSSDPPPPFPLTLAHHAGCILACADLGLPLVLAGHTHAGQVRLSARLAPHTSSDIPAHLATGILRLRETLLCISRGLGEGVIEHLRINCPWQAPLYTLRATDRSPGRCDTEAEPPTRGRVGATPIPKGSERTVVQVRAW